MSLWWAIVLASAGCYLFKLAGLSVPPSVLERPVVHRLTGLLPAALLAALVVVQVFGGAQTLAIDARLVALGAAAVMLWLRAPFIVVVAGSAAVAALLRFAGWG